MDRVVQQEVMQVITEPFDKEMENRGVKFLRFDDDI